MSVTDRQTDKQTNRQYDYDRPFAYACCELIIASIRSVYNLWHIYELKMIVCSISDVKMESYAAYGEVMERESDSHYETVKSPEIVPTNWLNIIVVYNI